AYFAHVQRQSEMDLRFARAATLDIAFRDLFRSGASRFESGPASWRGIFFRAKLENRQHPVAHELERLASFSRDYLDHRFEIIVEKADYFFTRQSVREHGEAAQIAEPNNRANRLAAATRDRAGQHAFSGPMADVSIHQM